MSEESDSSENAREPRVRPLVLSFVRPGPEQDYVDVEEVERDETTEEILYVDVEGVSDDNDEEVVEAGGTNDADNCPRSNQEPDDQAVDVGDVEDNVEVVYESNIAQEPNVIQVEDTPEIGIENPIVRLENPHYTPEKQESNDSLKRRYDEIEDDDVNQNCPVCLEPWTSAGPHRLCSLKCGHLFGKSCVVKWLSTAKRAACPQCNAKARKVDIRNLYATKLVALDTNEVTALKKSHAQVLEDNRELSKQLASLNSNLAYYKLLVSQKGKQCTCIRPPETVPISQFTCRIVATVKMEENSCRVISYSSSHDLVVVSQKCKNALWQGFGLSYFSPRDWKFRGFNILHKKLIRDLAFNRNCCEQVLSVGFDNQVKVFDVVSKTELFAFHADSPLWCCCWDPLNADKVFCGTARGSLLICSLAHADDVSVIPPPEDTPLPVISLHVSSKYSFVICCRTYSVTVYSLVRGDRFKDQLLDVSDGPFAAMCVDDSTELLILTSRPTGGHQIRHFCYKISVNNKYVSMQESHVFLGGTEMTRMSRPYLLTTDTRKVFFAFNESQSAIWAWCLESKSKILSIDLNRPVVDIIAFERYNKTCLLVLTTSFIRCYNLT